MMGFFVLSLSASQAGERRNDEYICRAVLQLERLAKESDL
jgi:hypothetical protein